MYHCIDIILIDRYQQEVICIMHIFRTMTINFEKHMFSGYLSVTEHSFICLISQKP